MNILLVAGPDANAVHNVWQTFQAVGVQVALPSRREKLLPEDIHDMMRQSLAHSPSMAEDHGGLNHWGSSKILGKVWDELASDLCMSNIGTNLWGWAMDDAAPMLDYWLDFDLGIRLVLAYISPIEHLQHHLQCVEEVTHQRVEQALIRWNDQSGALLARFHSHNQRCQLVHACSAHNQSALLSKALSTKWGIPLHSTQSPNCSVPPSKVAAYQQSLLSEMISVFPVTQALWEELQATAYLCAPEHPAAQLTVYQHWSQHVAVNSALVAQSNQALAFAEQVKFALETVAELESVGASIEADKAQLASTCAAELQEKELLLLQLRQVQEELEHYFLLHQHVSQQLQLQQMQLLPTSIQLNMSEPIEGLNWYHAESDGRWSGPGLISTLQMPSVAAGRYLVELHIQDAMQTDIVLGQQLCVVSKGAAAEPIQLVHNFSLQTSLYPMVSIGVVDLQTRTTPWWLQLELTHNVCPSESDGDDTRHLGLKMQAVRLIRQEAQID